MDIKKRKPNSWLLDQDFISRINYRDKFYIEQLFKQVSKFLDYCPVVVYCYWNKSLESIVFSVGSESKAFKVNMDVSYYDYTALVSRWLKGFFPQYKVDVTHERKLNEDEVAEAVANGVSFEDATETIKSELFVERGLIDRVFLLEDTVRLVVNGVLTIRQCSVPAADFLRGYRNIRSENDAVRREYIMNNSRLVSTIENRKEIVVDYDFNKMLNFFKIQIEDNWQEPISVVECDGEEWYKWGRFKFQLLTNELKKNFFHVYDSYKIRMQKKDKREDKNDNG